MGKNERKSSKRLVGAKRDLKILVTGGAGFIGSNLVERLVKTGHDVTSLDNYSSGNADNHIPGAKYIAGNTWNIFDLITFKPDIVFHLGEYSRIEQSLGEVDKVWQSNCIGTHEVIKFCVENGCKLVYTASSTKFADNGENMFKSPYSLLKAKNVDLVLGYSNWKNIDFAICYFYNVYGPRQIKTGKYATVIGIFEDQYERGAPLTVVSPGTQTRDFTHIDDVVRGMTKFLGSPSGDGYCFGTGKTYSIDDVAKMFIKNKGSITYLPLRKTERFNTEIDLYKSKNILQWQSEIELPDYIRSYIEEK